MLKQQQYEELINKAKGTKIGNCEEIVNPHSILGIPLLHVEPYAQWQGSLDAKILVIGQDFSDKETYLLQHGRVGAFESSDDNKKQTTNINLRHLFLKTFGIELGEPNNPNLKEKHVFLTNAVMGLKIGDKKKKGNMNARIRFEWVKNSNFLLTELINIINPDIIITLGKIAYQAISYKYTYLPKDKSLKELLQQSKRSPLKILNENDKKEVFLFPVYHCGKLGTIRRKLNEQEQDWNRMKSYLQ